jgi:hypothetical protein
MKNMGLAKNSQGQLLYEITLHHPQPKKRANAESPR